jgi:hypothetical protein
MASRIRAGIIKVTDNSNSYNPMFTSDAAGSLSSVNFSDFLDYLTDLVFIETAICRLAFRLLVRWRFDKKVTSETHPEVSSFFPDPSPQVVTLVLEAFAPG